MKLDNYPQLTFFSKLHQSFHHIIIIGIFDKGHDLPILFIIIHKIPRIGVPHSGHSVNVYK